MFTYTSDFYSLAKHCVKPGRKIHGFGKITLWNKGILWDVRVTLKNGSSARPTEFTKSATKYFLFVNFQS